MVSQHTLHHSKSKWEKASPLQKLNSKLQRKINLLEGQLAILHKKLSKRKEQARNDANVIKQLKSSLEKGEEK
jgi:hypothetical protein